MKDFPTVLLYSTTPLLVICPTLTPHSVIIIARRRHVTYAAEYDARFRCANTNSAPYTPMTQREFRVRRCCYYSRNTRRLAAFYHITYGQHGVLKSPRYYYCDANNDTISLRVTAAVGHHCTHHN